MQEPGATRLTVDSAVESIGFGRFQIVLVAVCGAMQVADAMEMILLSFLGRSVKCEWHLTSSQIAWLATCSFIGTIIGAPILGGIADRFGRWNGLLLSSCIIAYYGALSASSPDYGWLLVLRGFVGFAIGGILPLATTLTCEFLPEKYRAKSILIVLRLWTFGSLLEVLAAWLCLGSDGVLVPGGWRHLLAVTSVPLFLILPLFAWLPRSPRFLLASGQPAEALKQLNRAARANGVPELTAISERQTFIKFSCDLQGLFANKTLIRLTLVLQVVWFSCGVLYYGLVMLSTEMQSLPHHCLQNWAGMSHPVDGISSESCCHTFSSRDYATAAVATLGEFLGFFVVIVFVDTCGRRPVMAVNMGLLSILLVCLQFCMPDKLLAVLLFLVRSCAQSAFTCVYVYTSEAYPTTIRTLGMGVGCAMSRVGAILSPFIAQVLLPDYSVLAGLLTFSAVAVVGTVAVIFLPFETKGRALMQSAEEMGTLGPRTAGEQVGLKSSGDSTSYNSLPDSGAAT